LAGRARHGRGFGRSAHALKGGSVSVEAETCLKPLALDLQLRTHKPGIEFLVGNAESLDSSSPSPPRPHRQQGLPCYRWAADASTKRQRGYPNTDLVLQPQPIPSPRPLAPDARGSLIAVGCFWITENVADPVQQHVGPGGPFNKGLMPVGPGCNHRNTGFMSISRPGEMKARHGDGIQVVKIFSLFLPIKPA